MYDLSICPHLTPDLDTLGQAEAGGEAPYGGGIECVPGPQSVQHTPGGRMGVTGDQAMVRRVTRCPLLPPGHHHTCPLTDQLSEVSHSRLLVSQAVTQSYIL